MIFTRTRAPLPEGNLAVVRRPAPGRLRLAVGGLWRRGDREAKVEELLVRIAGVRVVSASALTGNALVLYDVAALDEEDLLFEGTRLLVTELDGHGRSGALTHARPEVTAQPNRGTSVTRTQSSRRTVSPRGPIWHALPSDEVAGQIATDPESGLTKQEAEERKRIHGPNRFPEPAESSLARLFFGQLWNAPSALLTAGAILSVATGGIADAILIGAVLIANATIGAATERSGHRAIGALKRSVEIRARVRRGGADLVVPAEELVPGDVVRLLPGDPVPADARLTLAHHLQIEESALTGESHPAEKHSSPVEQEMPLADRRSMVYRGTTVVGGHGEALVVATGSSTVLGHLRRLAAEAVAPPAPLERDLDRMGRTMALGATGICAGVFGLAALRGFGLLGGLATAVSLTIAAIPEGLAAIATTVLALGSGRMRGRGTLIRTLSAAEALGSVTVVCADKTGTVTENRMVAREVAVDGQVASVDGSALSTRGNFTLDGRRVNPDDVPGLLDALRIGALCTDATLDRVSESEVIFEGSPTEAALLVAAVKAGLDADRLAEALPRIDRRDRGNGRRHMVTVHRPEAPLDDGRSGTLIALAKGSPEEVLALCDRVARGPGPVPLDESTRQSILSANASMAGRGLRVLGLAARRLPLEYADSDLQEGFVWHGLVGLADPIRPAVPDAIRALHRAGIRTVMITGDQAGTATAIARELGLSRRGSLAVLEAGELTSLPPEELRGKVKDVGIFARVPPELKLEVVRALQANGEIVAMTGDGVNDAAALRAADVGVAMGEGGTELARDLADVVLSTDDFGQFVGAVEEGRLVRANVRRVLHYLLATNASEVWTVAGSVALGLASPLTPLQLLWLNLVSDVGPALGLATDPAQPGMMEQPPRDPREPIITGSLWRRIIGESVAITLGALGAYGVGLLRHGPGAIAQTIAFASLTGSQLLHVPLARTGDRPASPMGLPTNPVFRIGVGASVLLQVAAVFFPPLRAALGGAALGLLDLITAAVGSLLPILGIHAVRALQAPRRTKALGPG